MRTLILAGCVALTACAGANDLTPEQRAAILRYSQQQQELQRQQAQDAVDAYTAPARAAPPQQTITCTSAPPMLGTVVTNCR